MKISLKIFVFTYCIMMCITVFGGFALVNYLYQQDLQKAMDTASYSNSNLYTYIASLEDIPNNSYAEYSIAGFSQRMSRTDDADSFFVGTYEQWKKKVDLDGYTDLRDGQVVSNVIKRDSSIFIQITSRYDERYIINYYNIDGVIQQRDYNYKMYRRIIIIVSLIIAIVLYLFSWYITRPLSIVTDMAEDVSEGNYGVRVNADYRKMKSYEVAKLGETLNELAENTQEHINQLEDLAEKRTYFVGNFTHEIKTPLTSIIGYADLLRTYDLEPDKRREYSGFIYNEGKRLEQLSINLLDFIVMEKSEFTLVKMNTRLLFEKFRQAVHFSGQKYNINIDIAYENCDVRIEESLFVSAMINLVDNACKASEQGQTVTVRGIADTKEQEYHIIIADKGRGIPADELDKIKEPFYMVDKSRARKQGGAGLGLALCDRIIQIHGGRLEFESEVGAGTTVTICIGIAGDDDEK